MYMCVCVCVYICFGGKGVVWRLGLVIGSKRHPMTMSRDGLSLLGINDATMLIMRNHDTPVLRDTFSQSREVFHEHCSSVLSW